MSDTAAQHRLAGVCRAAVIALAARGAAATLMTAPGPSVAYATDVTADRLEVDQQTCGEGPSLSAFARQEAVIIDDLRGEQSRLMWPLLAHAVVAVDVGRFISLPVGVGGIHLGVLSIYDERPGALSGGQLLAAVLAADSAGLALLDAESEAADAVPLSELGPVLDYRIHQATGMVMGQTGVSAHDALTLLRARAFRRSVSLQRLATDVITRRARFDLEIP
jgi:hypothetical protein